MTNDPKPKNPLSLYYPSDVPAVPGNGRKWFAILLVLLFLLGAAHAVLSLVPS